MTKKPHVEPPQTHPVQLDVIAQMAIENLAEQLIRQVAMARGTQELAPPPAPLEVEGVAAPSKPLPAGEPRSPGEYAMRRGKPVPVPTAPAPAVTPEAAPTEREETAEIYQRVQAALTDKPYTFRDLIADLGLEAKDENRVKSVIVRLQRDGAPVVNLGNGSRAIWWIDVHDRLAAIATGRRDRK